jgi:phosphoglycerol transferase MdoB-like AlkP superfamily enzyme
MILGSLVAAGSYHLKIGTLMTPGPGLMPFALGIALFLCGFPMFIQAAIDIRKRKQLPDSPWSGINYPKIGIVLAALIAYGLFLEYAGFLVSALLLLLVLFKTVETQKWRFVLVASFVTVTACFLVFVLLLKVELPTGLVRRFW